MDKFRRRFLGSGVSRLRTGSLLAALSMLMAAAPDPKLAELTAALAQARGHDQAAQLEAELEALRMQAVPPAIRLLQRRSQRELMSGDTHAALSDADDAVGLQPDSALLWRERAIARAADGDLDAAALDLGGALSRDPNDALTWQALARIEEGRQSWMASYKAWQHVLSLDPQVADGAVRLDRLKRHALGQPA